MPDDLLISYSHADNQPLRDKCWVTDFHSILEHRIRNFLGRNPQIWRDPKLRSNDVFPEEIIQRLRGVAALVPVLSPSFVQSAWCMRELEEFCRAASQGPGDYRRRIFKVVKTPISDRTPPVLDVLLGGRALYVTDEMTGRVRELGPAFGLDEEYLIRIDELAQDICALLQEMQGERPSAPPEVPLPAVFLAETSFDLESSRDAVRRDLVQYGYRVVPEEPLPRLVPRLEETVRELLTDCVLSVHLIGRTGGFIPDGTEESVVALQLRIASEQHAEKKETPCLLWVPPDLEILDSRQEHFVRSLRSSPFLRFPSDLLEDSLEKLKPAIRRKLLASAKPAPLAPSAGDAARVYLILDHADRDREEVEQIAETLYRSGHDVIRPPFEGGEEDIRAEHEESLRACDAVLLFYGGAGELWQRRKQREILRIPALGRAEPLRAQAIYVAPPDTREKRDLRTHQPQLIRQPVDGFSPSLLDDFLARLEKRTERWP